MNDKDKYLLHRLKKNDTKVFTDIYNDYWKTLYISSYNLLKDKELCEEIIQDVFTDLWKAREKLEIRISLKSYLYACVRYKVFSEFRKNKIQKVELFEDLNQRFLYATPETKLMHQELVAQIETIVNTLPTRCQEVYRLSRNKQLSHKEIAEKLNISTKTVENHITHALKILTTALGNVLSIQLLFL